MRSVYLFFEVAHLNYVRFKFKSDSNYPKESEESGVKTLDSIIYYYRHKNI